MIDQLGRKVSLTNERWRHIQDRHPELSGRQADIKNAVESAEIRCRGRFENYEILYGDNLGPARWLAVVVGYEGDKGQVVTAYASTRGPKGKERL